MANPSKDKGDRYEREGVEDLIRICPDLLVPKPMRALGAGRKDDEGDLRVFPDCAIQVKAYGKSYISKAVYDAAEGAARQGVNAMHPYSIGFVLVPNARRIGAVRWITVGYEWPVEHEPVKHSSAVAAFAWIKAQGPDARVTAVVERKGSPRVFLGSLQTWLPAYREATGRPDPALAA